MKPTFMALLALCLCVVGCATLNDVGKHLLGADSKEGQSTGKETDPAVSPNWVSDPNNPKKPADLESYLTGKRIVFGEPVKSLAITQNTECLKNMRTLKSTIHEWALDKRRPDGAKVTLNDIVLYINDRTKSFKCPAGGEYTLTTIEENPKCSHGHSLDYERGDKLPPAKGKGPPPSAPLGFLQFNKDGALQMGEFDENGDAVEVDEFRTVKVTYKVTGPMEVTLEMEGEEEEAKLIFTKPNPAKGDALTLKEWGSEDSNWSILEITPVSPLKERKK